MDDMQAMAKRIAIATGLDNVFKQEGWQVGRQEGMAGRRAERNPQRHRVPRTRPLTRRGEERVRPDVRTPGTVGSNATML